MTAKQVHLVLVGTITLLCLGLVGGAYGANKLLSAEATKLVALKAESQALGQEQISLKKAKKDVQKYAELDKIAKAVVPEDKNQAEAVREIVNIAEANNISLASITFPASTLGNGAKSTSSSGAAAAAAPAPSASNSPNSKANALSQLLPVKSIAGIYQLQISVTSDPNQPVRYEKFIDFLAALEHNRRTAQVANISLTPNAKDGDFLSFALTLNEYIKP